MSFQTPIRDLVVVASVDLLPANINVYRLYKTPIRRLADRMAQIVE